MHRLALVALLAAPFLAGCGTPVQGVPFDPARPTFPTVEGDNLNNRRLVIPRDMDAPFAILLVAFEREQQGDVDTWLPAARELTRDHANCEYYELPVISAGFTIARGFIDGGMRRGIPDFSARERTVTIYTDVGRFRELAGYSRRIHATLVDRAGNVYWHAEGPATDAALAELRATARRLLAPAAPTVDP